MTKFNANIPKGLVFKTLIKNYPYAIVFKDKNFKTRFANDLFCSYFNIPAPSVVLGTSSIYFLSQENQEKIINIEKMIKKTPQRIDTKIHIKDGRRVKIYQVYATPVLKNGEFEGIIYTIKDITREESLNKRLKLKHTQLMTFLENIPLLAYLKDKDRNYVTGSRCAKEFIYYGRDIVKDISINPEQVQKQALKDDINILTNGEPISTVQELYDITGRKHWYQIQKVPFKDENDSINGIITIAKNIDAEKILEAQRETFVASIGHDLKNPTLAQIRALDLLLSGAFGKIPTEQKEIIEMVADSCKYMNAMLSSLLATYRNERGTIKLSSRQLSLIELVQECTDEMRYFAKDKDIKIVLTKDCDNDIIYADKVQLKRVIMNLLSNGIKYAFKNTILKVKVYKETDFLCFNFENNSPYISQEKQESIFAQYVSFAESHKELGIGLGLYASKKIIEAHEGTIFVESYENNTNIFGFKIPNKVVDIEKERMVVL